ncbi:MAG: hypothetical protein R3F22_09645 [Lysobacteraceae bacterium]
MPDAVSAAFFLSLWIKPLYFDQRAVANGMLVMLVEFILLHASVFLGTAAFAPDKPRGDKLKAIAGFGAFYLIFIAAWSVAFKAWWPLLAFGWLLLAKMSAALQPGQAPLERMHRMQSGWALGAMAYLAGVFLTVFIPVPRLGITGSVVSQLDLPGSGLWVSKPQTVIAFGVFYFGFLALAKWRDWLLPAGNLPGLKAHADRSPR